MSGLRACKRLDVRTLSFLSAALSFLSSPPPAAGFLTWTLRLGVPLPPTVCARGREERARAGEQVARCHERGVECARAQSKSEDHSVSAASRHERSRHY